MDSMGWPADVPVVRGPMLIMDRATGLAYVVRGWFPIPIYEGHGNVGEEDIPVAECGEQLSVVDLVDTMAIATPPAHATCLWCMRWWACCSR